MRPIRIKPSHTAATASLSSSTWRPIRGRLEEWYVGHAVELAAARVSIAELRAATTAVADRLPTQAGHIFRTWLRQLG